MRLSDFLAISIIAMMVAVVSAGSAVEDCDKSIEVYEGEHIYITADPYYDGYDYLWTLPSGWTEDSGGDTDDNFVTVDAPAYSDDPLDTNEYDITVVIAPTGAPQDTCKITCTITVTVKELCDCPSVDSKVCVSNEYDWCWDCTNHDDSELTYEWYVSDDGTTEPDPADPDTWGDQVVADNQCYYPDEQDWASWKAVGENDPIEDSYVTFVVFQTPSQDTVHNEGWSQNGKIIKFCTQKVTLYYDPSDVAEITVYPAP